MSKRTTRALTEEQWIKLVGKETAIAKLILAGLQPSTADKIGRRKYIVSTYQKTTREAFQKAMASDGYTFTDVKQNAAS